MKSLKKSKEKKGFSTTLKNKKTNFSWYEGKSDPASVQQNES